MVALAMVGLTLPASALDAAHDPANLTGERVRPQMLADALPQDQGAMGLEQALKRLGYAGEHDAARRPSGR